MAPEEVRKQVVHGDQDILISAPIEAGMELHARAAAVGVHPKESGTTVVLKTALATATAAAQRAVRGRVLPEDSRRRRGRRAGP